MSPVRQKVLYKAASGWPPLALAGLEIPYVSDSMARIYCFLTLPLKCEGMPVLAKLTTKNQLTLPKKVTAAVHPTEYFDVTVEHGRIMLTPVRINRADGVRAKLANSGSPRRT